MINTRLPTILITALILVQAVSAYSVSNFKVSPESNHLAGDPVSISFTFTPTEYGMYTSDPNRTIQFYTGLTNPTWQREMVIDGASSILTAKSQTLTIQGWDIAYYLNAGDDIGEHLNIVITGTAPEVPVTGEITALDISEYNIFGIKQAGGGQSFNLLVINRSDLAAGIHIAQTDLEKFDKDIKIIEQKGIDVTIAKAMYNNAVTSLNIAKNMPPAEYRAALNRLDEINTAVRQGEDLIDQQWAQQEVDRAAIPALQTNKIVGWFSGNNSTMSYPGFSNLSAENDNLKERINHMQNRIGRGDFQGARDEAAATIISANRTLQEAITLQRRAMDPMTVIYDNKWLIGIGVVVIVLILMFKPKKKKREEKKEEEIKPVEDAENERTP